MAETELLACLLEATGKERAGGGVRGDMGGVRGESGVRGEKGGPSFGGTGMSLRGGGRDLNVRL